MSIGTIESPTVARARKARAVQLEDPGKIAQADLDLRAAKAAKAAKAIQVAVDAEPPLPAEILNELRDQLPPAVREAS